MGAVGTLVLMFALATAAFGMIAAFIAAVKAREQYRKAAVRAFVVTAVLVLAAVVDLGFLLQTDTFTNAYVYGHSNAALPTIFKLTALWGGHQGSLLWWTLIVCVYMCVFLFLTRKKPKLMMSWALVFVGLTLTFFLVINNFVANPFKIWGDITGGQAAVPVVPRDGTGLNPQLQHWAMIIHPPLLYTGYIGFLFPFALVLGALITRMESREWIRMVRRWTLTAWLILGVGIVLGGAWAYMELGWGGYWAWDPVENASFMPWLLGTAFIHSVMAQEKRGMFKMWNVLLLLSTYLMCLFGTFITRSGLISSVHSFAKSSIGYYFIAFIIINAILCLVVVFMRRDQLVDDNSYESPSSREVGLLFNNILFIAVAFTMLLATIYPMLTEAIYDVKRELRHNFYNKVELPIFMALMLLMAIGPILTWKRTSSRLIRERFTIPTIALVVTLGIAFYLNPTGWMPNTSFAILAFLTFTILQEFYDAGSRRAKRAGENFLKATIQVVRFNKRRYGGYIVHFSVLLMAIGITGSAFNKQDKASLGVGGVLELGGYVFQVADLRFDRTENYQSAVADVHLVQDGKTLHTFHPEQRHYFASEAQASEVGIVSTLQRDFYVVHAGMDPDSTREHPVAVIHVYVNPLVMWIWIGSILMIFGTAVAMLPDLSRERVRASVPAATGEPA